MYEIEGGIHFAKLAQKMETKNKENDVNDDNDGRREFEYSIGHHPDN